MVRHILVATDGSKLSDKAVAAAIGLARNLAAKLTAFHATEDIPVMPYPKYSMPVDALAPAIPVRTRTVTYPQEEGSIALDALRKGTLTGAAVLVTP